ncbi:hypothetical protein ST47_g3587 [Ascochyta rabiei]|uniref:MCM3-like winged helix domain-containing protein n=1 Tax=Didymella rabiei TaxID=5454 RepID=A0A163HF97_DIDRA|nr:hypothetical protein ST47_g3587 [Ascochyta rabiei]
MASNTPNLSSRPVKGISEAPQQPCSSFNKRPRSHVASSSPVVIDSSENETPSKLSALSSKRQKTNCTTDAPSNHYESDTSDDEPLINRTAARASLTDDNKGVVLMSQVFSRHNTASSHESTVLASARPSLANDCNLHDDFQNVGAVERPANQTPATPATKGSVYGKKTNLTTAFKSASSGAKSSSRPNPFATNFLGLRNVSSADRVFTKMRLQEVKKEILTVRKAQSTGNNDRVPHPDGGTEKNSKDPDAPFEELPVVQSLEVPEEAAMADADRPEGFEIYSGTDADSTDDESDGTMAADSEDEYNASPTAARESRMGKENFALSTPHTGGQIARTLRHSKTTLGVRTQYAQQQSHIDRIARLTPATKVIDLTEDEPSVAYPDVPPSAAPDQDLPLAERLFPKSPTRPLSERLETTATREAAFLRGFHTQWWAGGLSLRAATRNVNAALTFRIHRFSEEEGKHRLLALSAKHALAIRHGLVYHLDCDPGPDAPALTPTPPRQSVHVSSAQRLLQECRKAEVSSGRPPHGKISEQRFRVFEMKLHSAVKIQKTLFQDGVELVERCTKVLNEWMNKNFLFSEKEIRAAFASLAKQGKVKFEGDVVALLALD